MLKGKNAREKTEYFWMYYKAPFLAILAVLLITGYWVRAAAVEKELAFSAMLVDCHASVSEEAMEQDFASFAGMDADTVSFQNSYLFSDSTSSTYAMTSLSRFYSDIGTEKLDVCGLLEQDFEKYAGSGTFLDLRECFTEEELSRYGANLYYYEGKPVGIYRDGLPGLAKSGCYSKSNAMIGIIYNTKHVGTAADYIRYLS